MSSLRSLFFVFILPLSLHAQSAQEDQTAPTNLRKAIAFLIWNDHERGLWIQSGDELLPIPALSTYRRSPEVIYEGPETIQLYASEPFDGMADSQLLPVPWQPDMVSHRPVGTVHVSAQHKQPLVILIENGKGRIEGRSFEDDPRDFPFGTYKIFNTTDREMMAAIDDKQFTLAPMQATQIDPEKGSNGVLHFRLAYRNDAGEWQRAKNTVFRYRVRLREIIFVRETGSGNSPIFETRTVQQYAPYQPEL